MTAVKVIKVLGTSGESWEDAAEEAVRQASQSVDDIRGVEIEDWTAQVEDGELTEYRATVEVAFPVHEDQQGTQ
jgi:flavin-binding protein dodecin